MTRCPITGAPAEPWVPDPVRAAREWDFEYPWLVSLYSHLACACLTCKLHIDMENAANCMSIGRDPDCDIWINDGND